MQLVTRGQWGARPPRSVTPLDIDMASVHWEGPRMGTFGHDECAAKMRGFQAFHMDSHGWADVAYNAVVCPHGHVFEGRGRGVRSAANGDANANSASYAVCYMGGEGDPFTDEAKNAINDAVEWLGCSRWGVHRDWIATACPGDEITEWVRTGHPRTGTQSQEDDEMFKPSEPGTVHISAAHSGLVWDLPQRGEHGAPVQTYMSDGGIDQRWRIIHHPNGTVSFLTINGTLALDVPEGEARQGTGLRVWAINWSDAQRFRIENLETFEARIVHAASGLRVDVAAGGGPGAPLHLWTEHTGLNQVFRFIPTV